MTAQAPQANPRNSTILSHLHFDGIDMTELGMTGSQVRSVAQLVVVASIIAGLAFSALAVRVWCDNTTTSIRKISAETVQLASVHEQLQLDIAARRSAGHLEQAAASLGLAPAATREVIHLRTSAGGAAAPGESHDEGMQGAAASPSGSAVHAVAAVGVAKP